MRRADGTEPSRRLPALTIALFVFAALYRFNTLGGALGGFDNDHFLHFAYAKQVQAGEQPLRDFLDGGLQGARPSLTYELSAAAQSLMGDTLRSEALLTVGGVALAAAVTFNATRRVAPWYWALVTSVLTVLVAPKLYNYPKVLVLATLAWLVVRYAASPSLLRTTALAAWIAVAFLFRHDYALYAAIAAAVVILATHRGAWWHSVGRLLACAAIASVLVAPSLWWIETHAGLRAYLTNAIAMGQREAARTGIGWPVPDFSGGVGPAFFSREENAEFWLYYVMAAIPLLWLVTWALRLLRRGTQRPEDAALLALAVMTALMFPMFVRGNLAGRFGDIGPPIAVLGAALLAQAFGAGRPGLRPPARALTAAVALFLLAGTTLSISAIGSVPHELAQSGLSESARVVGRQTARMFRELADLPATVWSDPAPRQSMQAAQYLNRCTAADDRVLIASYAPEILAFADRRFAGGRASLVPGFYTEDLYGAQTLARLRARPPIAVLVEVDYTEEFPQLRAWFERDYAEAGAMSVDSGRTLRLLTRRDRPPVSTFAGTGWPCFR